MIELQAITKQYALGQDTFDVLSNINLSIASGEYVAITGTSGSGKSTLMNILGCLDRPTSGLYKLNGRSVNDSTESCTAAIRNQQLGFVFQSFNLMAKSTALENVMLPLIYAGISLNERKSKASAVLESVGLGHRLHHRPTEMSGGQRQRVAIARALVNDPLLLLADEPTGNLDSHTTDEILDLFEQLRGRGHTIVMVTHEQEVASRCDRVLTMRDGNIVTDITKRRSNEALQ